MIRSLRRGHAWMWFLLSPLMAWILIASLNARQSFPSAPSEPPDKLTGGEVVLPRILWDQGSAIEGKVVGRLNNNYLILTPQQALKKPDVLVYWTISTLDDGYLLGGLNGTSTHTYSLPEAAENSNGFVIIYSLAHQMEIDRAPLNPGGL